MSSGSLRTIGVALMTTAALWVGGWVLWLAAQHRAGSLDVAAAALGFLLFALLPAAVGAGGGAVALARARRRRREEEDADLERRVAEAVRTRGVVRLAVLAAEWGLPEATLRDALQRLVGLDLFHGTVDWESGEVRSPQVRLGARCSQCGGELVAAGKGLLACRYCGAHYPMEDALT